MNDDYTPPNPYEIRPAPTSTFEQRYTNMRMRALQLEYAEAESFNADHPQPRVLGAAELDNYTPPNPYEAGIKAWKEQNR
jgi:hypothetical protein